jgi:type II restriction/modification system DNA methylase subunit YeeA
MALSWNEIKKRSVEFVKEFENEERENAEAKTFWDSFFFIFGITRRRVAAFEEPVKKLDKEYGYIDLFWKSNLIVEHKSKGKDLDKAYDQAIAYFPGIKEEELPRYVLVSDFSRFRLYDLEDDSHIEFTLKELTKNIHHFGFILGYQKKTYKDEDPVNIQAAEMMGKLHDALLESGYSGHKLEAFLVRILFCLFADDTGIFSKDHFHFYLENKTKEDASDLGMHLSMIFQTLNTDESSRQKNLDEDIAVFPYVNGSLFEEQFPAPSFDSTMRKILLSCAGFDWSKISPAIFGSMFQSATDKEKRRNLGAHYTSEKNILKVVKGLFLDALYTEFEDCKHSLRKLEALHEKIAKLKFLDPACGCGNFLIITYRELRLLEIEILKQIFKLKKQSQLELNVELLSKIDVDCMFGIEYEEFPARIAEVALYLTDHLCNTKLSEVFGQYYRRLPLKKSPNIIHDNALRLDWNKIRIRNWCADPKTVVTRHAESSTEIDENNNSFTRFDYILGNPPFVSKANRTREQNEDMGIICTSIKNYGLLDYVCAWYVKAEQYINRGVEICLSPTHNNEAQSRDEACLVPQGNRTTVAFVSTNSITQGEQVGVLWNYLLKKNIKIHFAHRTFKWTNEARGQAAVYCVIIGFSNFDITEKFIFDYETPKSDPQRIKAKNINPYLIDTYDIIIENRNEPISTAPPISFGSMPNDDGNFLFTDDEMKEFLKIEPKAKKFIKPLISAKEFLNGEKRWCLWLESITPVEIRFLPEVARKIEAVKKYRLNSTREATIKLAEYPYLFGEIRQPKSHFIFIPLTSSENRKYIPIAFFNKENIVNNTCSVIEKAGLYHFGILTSLMHNAWMRQVCGRLEARYRYSNKLVYNNFPFPKSPTEKQIARIESSVKEMLAVREKYFAKGSTLADLYDPVAMPKDLTDAHKEIDDAVDQCYRKEKFRTELERLEFLFELYKEYTTPLNFTESKKKKRKTK